MKVWEVLTWLQACWHNSRCSWVGNSIIMGSGPPYLQHCFNTIHISTKKEAAISTSQKNHIQWIIRATISKTPTNCLPQLQYIAQHGTSAIMQAAVQPQVFQSFQAPKQAALCDIPNDNHISLTSELSMLWELGYRVFALQEYQKPFNSWHPSHVQPFTLSQLQSRVTTLHKLTLITLPVLFGKQCHVVIERG